MTRSFFRDAAAAVIVYDVCDPVTLASVRGWVEDFRVSVDGSSANYHFLFKLTIPACVHRRSNARTRS